jgi:hypothetical protein
MDEATAYSHPDSAIRHSYPLASRETGFMAAMNLCLKTLPFMGARLALLMGFTLLAMVWFGITFGAAAILTRATNETAGFWGLLIAFGVPIGFFMSFKRYVLYLLEAAHIAVLTRLITHGSLESDSSQISYGKDIIASHFGEVNMLLVLDAIIQGVVRAFTNTVDWIIHLLPIPGMDGPLQMVKRILQNATGYVEDAIFSYNLARGDDNKWRSSKDGLIYYAQNWKPVLKTATYALLLEYALTGMMFLVFLVPAFGIGALIPKMGAWALLFAGLFALNFKAAVLHPLFLTMVMLTYHNAIHDQPINLEWDQTLNGASDKFKELTEKARTWVGERTGAEAPGTPTTQTAIS